MAEGTQPDECTPEVYWEVSWKSPVSESGVTRVLRRKQEHAYERAQQVRGANGFDQVKLHRVERTEMDF